jgi:hypothetical protein
MSLKRSGNFQPIVGHLATLNLLYMTLLHQAFAGQGTKSLKRSKNPAPPKKPTRSHYAWPMNVCVRKIKKIIICTSFPKCTHFRPNKESKKKDEKNKYTQMRVHVEGNIIFILSNCALTPEIRNAIHPMLYNVI